MTISLGDALEAFILEHVYCGELDAAGEEDRVWLLALGLFVARLLTQVQGRP